MATEFYYNDGGTWRKAKEIHYNDGGTWRKAKELWFNDGGTWRKVFSGSGVANPLPTMSPNKTVLSGTATATLVLQSDGVITATSEANGLWYLPIAVAGIGSSYWVKAHKTGGTGIPSGTLDAWVSLAAGQSWSISAGPTVGFKTLTLSIDIAADSAGTQIVGSGTATFIAQRDA